MRSRSFVRSFSIALPLFALAASAASGAAADTPKPRILNLPPALNTPVPNPSPVVLGGVPRETPEPELVWKWQRFSTIDYAITIAGAGLTLAAAIIPPRNQHVYGPVLFDEAARDLLHASGVQTRYTFRDASDVGLSLAVTWPFFVDALVSAWWLRGSRDVAQEIALIDLETLAISSAIQGTTNMLVSRERPYGHTCGSDVLPDSSLDCDGTSRYRSFFSGHSAFSFTSAALVCIQHLKHELLGGPWDALSCAAAYAVATTTATFRVVGDMHYASDVLTGAFMGSLVGYGIPLLHYARVDLGTVQAGTMTLRIVPSAGGAGVVGVF